MWYNMIRVLKISLTNIDHLFLGDTWEKFWYEWWNVRQYPMNWAKVKPNWFILPYQGFLEMSGPVISAGLFHSSSCLPASVWFPHHIIWSTRQWSWQTITPAALCIITATALTLLTWTPSTAQPQHPLRLETPGWGPSFSFRLWKLATPNRSHLRKHQL